MADFKGSETEKNLMAAFAGESKARNKYTFYSMIAKKEGYDYISRIFEETANNEKEHAKIWFKWLNNGEFPHTLSNLEDAVKGENEEWNNMYESFAQKADEEGFAHIAQLFRHVAKIEKQHEEVFKKLILTIQDNDIAPDKDGNFNWECSACGAFFTQKEKPDFCPLCLNEDIFFYKRQV